MRHPDVRIQTRDTRSLFAILWERFGLPYSVLKISYRKCDRTLETKLFRDEVADCSDLQVAGGQWFSTDNVCVNCHNVIVLRIKR